MSENDSEWVALLTGGMGAFVVAHLLFEGAVWYAQYGLYAVALLLLFAAVVRGGSESSA